MGKYSPWEGGELRRGRLSPTNLAFDSNCMQRSTIRQLLPSHCSPKQRTQQHFCFVVFSGFEITFFYETDENLFNCNFFYFYSFILWNYFFVFVPSIGYTPAIPPVFNTLVIMNNQLVHEMCRSVPYKHSRVYFSKLWLCFNIQYNHCYNATYHLNSRYKGCFSFNSKNRI